MVKSSKKIPKFIACYDSLISTFECIYDRNAFGYWLYNFEFSKTFRKIFETSIFSKIFRKKVENFRNFFEKLSKLSFQFRKSLGYRANVLVCKLPTVFFNIF